MTGRYTSLLGLSAAAALFIYAMFSVHRREVVSVRAEAKRCREIFKKNTGGRSPAPSFRVLLGTARGEAHPAGILKQNVDIHADEAVVTTDFSPGENMSSAARNFSFRQETVIRRDVGVVKFSADLYLPGRAFFITAQREGDAFDVTVKSGEKKWRKRLPAAMLASAAGTSAVSYLSPFDDHPKGGLHPGDKVRSWKLDPVSMSIRPMMLVVGAPVEITVGAAAVTALPVQNHGFPPAKAWYSPDGTLLKASVPISEWRVVLERIGPQNAE